MSVAEPVNRQFGHDLRVRSKFISTDEAVVDAESLTSLNYAELFSLSTRVDAFVSNQGVQRGETILSLLPSDLTLLLVALGSLSCGYSFAPIANDSTEPEVQKAVDMLQPQLALLPPFASSEVEQWLHDRDIPVVMVDTSRFINELPPADDDVSNALDSTSAHLYLRTSGTTGEPKFLAHSIDRLWSSAVQLTSFLGVISSNGRFLNTFRLDSMAGLFNMSLIPLAAQGTIVLDSGFHTRPGSARVWQHVRGQDVNFLWVTPDLLRDMVEKSNARSHAQAAESAGSLKAVFVGMASVNPQHKIVFEETYRVPVLENFALSETTFISFELAGGRQGRDGSGQILPWVEVAFRRVEFGDEAGPKSPLTEILVSSPYQCLGYIGPGGGLESLPQVASGMMPTGDLGELEENGCLKLEGRIKEIIKRHGEMINLREIEMVARENDAVRVAAAVAVGEDAYGETYVLFLESGSESEMLEGWLHNRIPRRNWPNRVISVRQLPYSIGGKIAKNRLLTDYLNSPRSPTS